MRRPKLAVGHPGHLARERARDQLISEAHQLSDRFPLAIGQAPVARLLDMHDAWEAPPLDNDAGMNITHLDYAELKQPEEDYLTAVKTDVSLMRLFVGGRRQ
jgi:hypothetical protein